MATEYKMFLKIFVRVCSLFNSCFCCSSSRSVLTDNSSISDDFNRESSVTLNVLLNATIFSTSGITCPLSYFEIDCLETFNCSANCSCVNSLPLRSAISFSENSIWVPPLILCPYSTSKHICTLSRQLYICMANNRT